jgi:hypothetical protein
VKRYWLLLLLEAVAACTRSERPPLARAADYLWSKQAADGGWHSETYGLLRSGQSLTPFVLEALLQVPEQVYPLPASKLDRALAFIHAKTQEGALGLSDDIPDYPNYATALAVSAMSRAPRTGAEAQIKRMLEYLRTQQFTEQNGWRPQDPAYGAWGMGGQRRTRPDTGHVDLSMTRHVLDALRMAGVPAADPLYERARIFIERCQNFDPTHPDDLDGGFFFSTTEHDTNKAGHDGKHFRSYGTTTADGILALLATGARADDPRVLAARRWLTSRHHDMAVPGVVGESYKRWPRGLGFYYASAATIALRAVDAEPGASLIAALKRTQREDGSWSNPENLVKEDDPYIATPFAVRALVHGGSRGR